MELEVLNKNGEQTGRKVKIDDSIVGIEPNHHAIYLDVKRIQAAKRQGTHKAKERSDLSGSGTKLRRQKGTGFARVGDIKNPIFRGGARVFGPKPRKYDLKVNKKVQRLARKSALASKVQDNQLLVMEDLSFDEPKTKEFQEVINNLELTGTSTLLVTRKNDRNLSLSLRNIPYVSEYEVNSLNTDAILRYNTLILSEGVVEDLQANLKN